MAEDQRNPRVLAVATQRVQELDQLVRGWMYALDSARSNMERSDLAAANAEDEAMRQANSTLEDQGAQAQANVTEAEQATSQLGAAAAVDAAAERAATDAVATGLHAFRKDEVATEGEERHQLAVDAKVRLATRVSACVSQQRTSLGAARERERRQVHLVFHEEDRPGATRHRSPCVALGNRKAHVRTCVPTWARQGFLQICMAK